MGHGVKERDLPIFVSLGKTKQGETPEFTYKENKVETKGDYLSGIITDITLSEYEWPKDSGKMRPTFILHMVDQGQKYKFETTYTSMSRAILNCLMTVEFPGMINIQVVPSKEDGGYPSVFVSVDEGKALSWKWKYEKLSELIDGEGEDKNYDRLNTMWGGQIEETLAPHFKEAFSRMSHHGNFAAAPAPTDETESEEIKDESVKSKDIDLSEQHPKQEDPAPTDLPVIEEKSDDLPF